MGTCSQASFVYVQQVVQYLVKLIIPILEFRARLQFRAGLRPTSKSIAAERWAKLGTIIGDSRILWRSWGKFLNNPSV